MIGFWRRIGIALGLVEPTWIEEWVLALRRIGWEGKIVTGYRISEDQVARGRIDPAAVAAGSEPGPIFDWTYECPEDFPCRSWPAVVGEGRGKIFRLDQSGSRPQGR